MKHKMLSDSQSDLDDLVFSMGAHDISASFNAERLTAITAVNGLANPLANPSPEPSATVPFLESGPVTDSVQSAAVPASTMVSQGGITFNLIWSNAAANIAPAWFRAGIVQAATLLAADITDKITVNIKVDYDGTHGLAFGGPDGQPLSESYSSIRADLIGHASPGDTSFDALPMSISGQSNIDVYGSQAKLWGLLGANDITTDDGSVEFATDTDPKLLAGVALHELTHALGRIPVGP